VALAAVEDVKQYLGKADTNQDSLLKMLVEGVSSRLERLLGEWPNDGSVITEYIQSTGTPRIPLNRVVNDIRTVVEGTTTLSSTDYRLVNEQSLERLTSGLLSAWNVGEVVVTYRPGWLQVPEDLKLACVMQAAYEYKQTKPGGNRLGLVSDSPSGTTGEAVSYTPHTILPAVQDIVDSRRPL